MPPSLEAGPRIALLVDKIEFHARELTRAPSPSSGRARVPMRLSAFSLDTRRPSGIAIPGFGTRLPDLVLVRAVGLGTFESTTLRLGLLHALVGMGVPVANSPRSIELCVDKAATSFRCFNQGVATPETFALESPRQTRALIRREAPRGPLVLKPLFGAQGRPRPQADPPRIRSAGHRRDGGGILSTALYRRRTRWLFPIVACSSRAAACLRR